MNNIRKLVTVLKGMIVGGTLLVPGVSGGTMAMILGVYDSLISSVSSFMKHKGQSALFLALFSLGGCLGMFLFANPLLGLINMYPMAAMYFFIGAIAGGIPLIFKQAKINGFSLKIILYIAIGILIVSLFAVIPSWSSDSEVTAGLTGFLLLMVAGFVAAIALVLPGISVSYLLLIMGLYNETMKAISQLYLPFLIPLGIGLLLGIVLTTKILERAMTNYPQPTYLIILGFVLGSVAEVFPGVPSGLNLLICPLTLAAGFLSIRLLSRKAGSGQ